MFGEEAGNCFRGALARFAAGMLAGLAAGARRAEKRLSRVLLGPAKSVARKMVRRGCRLTATYVVRDHGYRSVQGDGLHARP